MKKQKLFTALLSAVLLLNVITIPQTAFALESVSSVSWQDKISDDVYESPIYENGKRLVYIDRVNIPKEKISKHLLKNYKYDSTVYENETRYEAEIVPAITAKVVAELGEKEAYSTQRQFELTEEKISAVDLALSEHYDEYITAKRSATKDLYDAFNIAFLKDNIDNEDDIIYQGEYTSSFILYASDAEIEKYAKCADVEQIVAYYNYEVSANSIPEEQTQISVDSVSGTKSSQFNSGNGYKGTGVKIGIIEANQGEYFSSAPQLSSIDGGRLKFLGNADGTTATNTEVGHEFHATAVTSIIVGQPYTKDGCTYEGVVPNSTVYQMGVSTIVDIVNAFNKLVSEKVSIINCTVTFEYTDNSYNIAYDGEIDELIESTGVTFVISAGNTYATLESPSKAYNAITVGNLETKGYMDSEGVWHELWDAYQNNFQVRSSSSYMEASGLANKPDVVAPGTGIDVPISSSEIKNCTGTSFSAPLVAGIVAQLHQAKPLLRVNPTATKAIIVAGANHDKVYNASSDSAVIGNVYLRERSGAGLVDAVRSMEIALASTAQYSTFQFNIGNNVTTMPDMDPCCLFSVPAGKKVRFVMTFNKIDDSAVPTTGLRDNVNIAIYNNANDQLVAYSSAVYENVEIVEFNVSQATQFYVVTSLPSFVQRSSGSFLTFSVAYMLS